MQTTLNSGGSARLLLIWGALFLFLSVALTACGGGQQPTTTNTTSTAATSTTKTTKLKIKGLPKGNYILSGSGSILWTLVPHVPGCTGSMPHSLPLTVQPTEIDISHQPIIVTLQGMNFGVVSMECGGHAISASGSNGGPLQMTLVIGPPTTFTESQPTPPLQGLFGFTSDGFIPQTIAGCSTKTTTSDSTTTTKCKTRKGPTYMATATLSSYPCLSTSGITCNGSGTMRLVLTKE
ncbi:MAG: hypothetical protein ACYDET_05695 [Thermoleophilia bacterium]